MYREECEPVRRGRKLRMAVARWRSRRSRPSVTPDPSRSARVRPTSIEQGTPIMARSSSAISDGDRGDGTALTTAQVCTTHLIRRSLTDAHPRHVNGERAGRRRSCDGSCIGPVLSDKRATRVSRHLPGGQSRGRNGSASKPTGSRHAYIDHTGSAVAAGLVPRACRLRPPDQRGLHVTIADTAPRR